MPPWQPYAFLCVCILQALQAASTSILQEKLAEVEEQKVALERSNEGLKQELEAMRQRAQADAEDAQACGGAAGEWVVVALCC